VSLRAKEEEPISSGMKSLNFDIIIAPSTEERYEISAISDGKPARCKSEAPSNLTEEVAELQRAIFRSARSTRRDVTPGPSVHSPTAPLGVDVHEYHACEQFIKNLGKRLFDFLFAGEVGESYRKTLDNANREGRSVRLNLHIDERARSLASAPWEALYDPRLRTFLTTRLDTQFTRTVGLASAPISKPRRLHILGMIASPTEFRGRPVTPIGGTERDGIVSALEPLEQRGRAKLQWTQSGSLRDLVRGLRRSNLRPTAHAGDREPWGVFHFIGHGDFDSSRSLGFVLMEGEGASGGQPCYADDLASVLCIPGGPQLVVLNACNGALSTSGDIFNSTAALLALSGIPAVIAMQFPVTDKTATYFAEKLYDELADGVSIQEALVNTRVHLRSHLCPEWVTPVLYLAGSDGELVRKPFG
jgi:hypothetical protein